jgi:hypothetical protein
MAAPESSALTDLFEPATAKFYGHRGEVLAEVQVHENDEGAIAGRLPAEIEPEDLAAAELYDSLGMLCECVEFGRAERFRRH